MHASNKSMIISNMPLSLKTRDQSHNCKNGVKNIMTMNLMIPSIIVTSNRCTNKKTRMT